MQRRFYLSIIGWIVLGVSGCSREEAPPTPPSNEAPEIHDAELQQIEEEEARERDGGGTPQ